MYVSTYRISNKYTNICIYTHLSQHYVLPCNHCWCMIMLAISECSSSSSSRDIVLHYRISIFSIFQRGRQKNKYVEMLFVNQSNQWNLVWKTIDFILHCSNLARKAHYKLHRYVIFLVIYNIQYGNCKIDKILFSIFFLAGKAKELIM